MRGTVNIFWRNREVEVDFYTCYDPGVDMYSNGDPGYPPSSEFSIEGVRVNGKDFSDVLNRFDKRFPCLNPTTSVVIEGKTITEETPTHLRYGIWEELENALVDSDDFQNYDDEPDYEPDFDFDF